MEILSLWSFFIIAFFGGIVHVIKKLAKVEETNSKVKVKSWWKGNKFRTILGLCLALASILVLHQSGQLNYAAAFAAGFLGDSFTHKQESN